MTFIRAVKVKGHLYYRFVESYRDKNGKVKQRVLKHVGNSLAKLRKVWELELKALKAEDRCLKLFPWVRSKRSAIAEYERITGQTIEDSESSKLTNDLNALRGIMAEYDNFYKSSWISSAMKSVARMRAKQKCGARQS